MRDVELLRANDLPPLWDGNPIEWEGWQAPQRIFICPPPPPEPCPACRRYAVRVINRGVVTVRGVARIGRGWTTARITAHRCPHCRFDQVVEELTCRVWDLDWTDYSDDGSVELTREHLATPTGRTNQ